MYVIMLFQSFKFDPDTCAKLQRTVQHDAVWMMGVSHFMPVL